MTCHQWFSKMAAASLIVLACAAAPNARAQGPSTTKPATPPTSAGAAAPSEDHLAEARRRYQRALELSDEGNYDEAILELQRAYQLAPTYRLLYNLGVVSVAVRDYVKGIDYFNRYLAEGGTQIDAARTAEVQQQIERLKARIAKLTITISLPNADIAIDDVPVGKAPLTGPVVVSSGRRRVTASLAGYLPAVAVVEVAGNEAKSVTLVLMRATAAERPSRPIPWIGWGITAALGAGCAITGALALKAGNDYDSALGNVNPNGADINSAYRKMRTYSITSDVFLSTAVIAAGVSLYFTLRSPRASKEKEPTAAFTKLTPFGLAF